MSHSQRPDPPTSPGDVRPQLERILASQSLAGSDQLKRFLRLVVERTLNGQPELLKEYNLGLEVFQRPPDYDPKVDPIVRVQARRLRSKLDAYYGMEGLHDPILITIPKGAYVPAFEPRPTPARRRKPLWLAFPHPAILAAALGLLLIAAWMTRDRAAPTADRNRSIAVLPLRMFTEGQSRSQIAAQVSEVLTTRLAQNRRLSVLSRTTAERYRNAAASLPAIAQELGVRWIVEGGVGIEGDRVYLKLRVVDSLTDRKVWADVFDCERSELVARNTQAADRIADAVLVQQSSRKPDSP